VIAGQQTRIDLDRDLGSVCDAKPRVQRRMIRINSFGCSMVGVPPPKWMWVTDWPASCAPTTLISRSSSSA
jgi:hypothetical protein